MFVDGFWCDHFKASISHFSKQIMPVMEKYHLALWEALLGMSFRSAEHQLFLNCQFFNMPVDNSMKGPCDEDLTVSSHINQSDFSHPQRIQAARFCNRMRCSSFQTCFLLEAVMSHILAERLQGRLDFFVSKEITVQIKLLDTHTL